MKNKTFIFLIAVIVALAGLFFAFKNKFQSDQAVASAVNPTTSAENSFRMVPFENAELIKSHSPVLGLDSAKVTLVEFLDPECEACAAMSPYVKQILKEYQKDIRLVVRYMTYHKNSKYVANILEGARDEKKYWETLDLLFKTQSTWADHHNPKPELIPEVLKPLGLNLKKIIADAESGKFDQQIIEDFEDGKRLGVQGTPTFFVNGKKIEELGYESLKSAIDQQLKMNQ